MIPVEKAQVQSSFYILLNRACISFDLKRYSETTM